MDKQTLVILVVFLAVALAVLIFTMIEERRIIRSIKQKDNKKNGVLSGRE